MLKNKNTRVIYVDWFYRDNFPASQRSKKKIIIIKEALSLEKMKAEAKLHHVVAERNKAKFKEKDSKMLNEI